MVPNITTALYINDSLVCREKYGHAFQAAVGVITTVLGLPANMMVLWILLRKQTAISSSEVFEINLAVMDALYCLNTPLDIYHYYFAQQNGIVRIIVFFFYGFNTYGGPLFLCCICMERYMAVVYPITYLGFKSLTYRVLCSVAAWAITLAFSIYSSMKAFDATIYVYTGYISALFIVMIFCNISILRVLRRSSPGRDEIHPMKKKAFRMVSAVLMIVFVSCFPAIVIFPLKPYFNVITFKCSVVPVAFCFVGPSSCIQPFLYLSSVVTFSFWQYPCNGPCCLTLSSSP
ncbi:proteinase-activated receptor 3-like [Huso huso]|uniref:Proteinase-activated receptor 3-like n=1 Tax=Huso huso TaxID=61971 RepID=A0ABR1A606_HUSHU